MRVAPRDTKSSRTKHNNRSSECVARLRGDRTMNDEPTENSLVRPRRPGEGSTARDWIPRLTIPLRYPNPSNSMGTGVSRGGIISIVNEASEQTAHHSAAICGSTAKTSPESPILLPVTFCWTMPYGITGQAHGGINERPPASPCA